VKRQDVALFTKCNKNDLVKGDEVSRVNSMNGEKRNAYRLLVEKPDGKTSLGRPRHR
jgi:hypothetical protein